MIKKGRTIPFGFCLEALESKNPITKPMFGAYGVYVDSKIVLILRDRDSNTFDNGVWIATTAAHHKSLAKEFKSMRSIELFGPGPTGWQNLPSSHPQFESDVYRVVELILASDPRIGKIPQRKLKATKRPGSKTQGAKPKKILASRKKGAITSR